MATRKQTTRPCLTADDLRGMFAAGRTALEMRASAINALNVFPVPDGDTGTNMLLTLKAVDEELVGLEGAGAGRVAQAMARGTLMGARGNSGVILSQFFQGCAEATIGLETIGAAELAGALVNAARSAYKAVSQPVEGTMLTVAREAATAAQESAKAGEMDPGRVWAKAYQAAREALATTPDLLPVLKEAGVVDAGGMGLVAIMEGALAYLRGEEVAPSEMVVGQAAPALSYLASTEAVEYGYCTQFLLQGSDLTLNTVRERMASMARSAVVVGDSTAIKVHVHTDDPGPVISYAVSLGTMAQVKIDNMDHQHREYLERNRERSQETVPLGVVAVASGQGIQRVFSELGALSVVPGGQTMNPSTRDLVAHAAQANAAEVILLPNNPNIVSTARQAASASTRPLHVVPSISIPQGVAALLAFSPDSDLPTNLALMRDAMARVRSGEVTRAVRSTSVNGKRVQRGQAIALLDGELVATATSPSEALHKLCTAASPAPGSLVTLYWGSDTQETHAQATAESLRARCPGVEVELVHGGQPHYDYLVSIE